MIQICCTWACRSVPGACLDGETETRRTISCVGKANESVNKKQCFRVDATHMEKSSKQTQVTRSRWLRALASQHMSSTSAAKRGKTSCHGSPIPVKVYSSSSLLIWPSMQGGATQAATPLPNTALLKAVVFAWGFNSTNGIWSAAWFHELPSASIL